MDLQALLQLHRVPDVEFVLNVDDYPKARDNKVPTSAEKDAPLLPMALFSYCKRERIKTGASRDYDLLVPTGAFRMSLFERKLLSRSIVKWEKDFPWQSKDDKAYFRGTPYCSMPEHRPFGRCSRYLLAHLAANGNRTTGGAASVSASGSGSGPPSQLDVGLVEYNAQHDTELQLKKRTKVGKGGGGKKRGGGKAAGRCVDGSSGCVEAIPLTQAPRVSESEWWKHKYLLQLDGHTFSNRLQALLLSNSLVLKQESEYVEYYYRALRRWEHYVPIMSTSADDVLDILPNLTKSDEYAQAIAKRGQEFAHNNLHVDARMCYWRKLLHGWRRRLAYVPTLSARLPEARVSDGRVVCGECMRGSNPDLIGPWAQPANREKARKRWSRRGDR